MSNKNVLITIGVGLLLLLSLTLFQSCGKMSGEMNPSQPPTVEIINVPQDANGITTTALTAMPFKVAELDVPFTIFSMDSANMVDNSWRVYWADTVNTITYVSGSDYHLDAATGQLTAFEPMIADTSLTYYIDFTFTISNYYVMSSAPTVYWSGYDPDGFVDHYRYADVTDLTFISAFKSAPDPSTIYIQYKNNPSVFNWVDTTATSARIYLLTTQGQIAEHLLFLQAVDNENYSSVGMVYKTFYRSNNAPNNPQIKPQTSPDADFALNYILSDTLFCLDEITPLWAGISFNWRADDPDDKELTIIPLMYRYFLIKTPGDTIWEWSSQNWSELQLITLYGLETGSYLFTVWTRDDGYTSSALPATIAFKVVRPTFENHILVVDETSTTSPVFCEVMPRTAPREFYINLLSDLADELSTETYIMDGVDVRVKDNSNQGSLVEQCPIPYTLISQYKLVFIFSDDHGEASTTYISNRDTVLANYLDVGGRVWIEGRKMLKGTFGYGTLGITDISTGGSATHILSSYFQLLTGFVTNFNPNQKIEFLGAVPQIGGLPELNVDASKIKMINTSPVIIDTNVLMEVDWFTRSDQAQTLYAFNSITADPTLTDPYVNNWQDNDSVIAAGATPVQCWIMPEPAQYLEVYHIAKIMIQGMDTTRIEAEVENFNDDSILVSYEYDEPWVPGDTIEVNYKYDPISDMHLKPVAVRYEAVPYILRTIEIQGIEIPIRTYVLGYRTSLFTFPLFFMCSDNNPQSYEDVKEAAKEMLDWFFYPSIH